MTNIYGLFDPRFPDVIMYVGKGLKKRAANHWKQFLRNDTAQNAVQYQWFEKLKTEELIPGWKFLEEGVENWEEREIYWISYWRKLNPELCNISPGGTQWPLEAGRSGGYVTQKLYPNLSSETLRKTHKLYPNMAKENIQKTHKLYPELFRKRGYELGSSYGAKGMHTRWHVARNKFNPACIFCMELKNA